MKERITVPFEVKATDTQKRQIEGYSATWDLDLGGDIIQKGAFSRTITHFKAARHGYIPLLDTHDPSSIFNALGHLIDAEEDERGLKSLWQVIDGVDGERVMNRVSSGAVRKKSIGYTTVRAKNDVIRRDGTDYKVRRLLEIKWEETSLVIFPMNPAADITAVKSYADMLDAIRAGTLTSEQKLQIRALLEEADASADASEDSRPNSPPRHSDGKADRPGTQGLTDMEAAALLHEITLYATERGI